MRPVPAADMETALDNDAKRLMADPEVMSIALLNGMIDTGRIRKESYWPESLDEQGRRVCQIYDHNFQKIGERKFGTSGRIVLGSDGARFHPGIVPIALEKEKGAEVPPEAGARDLAVTQAENRRAIRIFLAFRLAKSVGPRWSKMARPFRIDASWFAVMSGALAAGQVARHVVGRRRLGREGQPEPLDLRLDQGGRAVKDPETGRDHGQAGRAWHHGGRLSVCRCKGLTQYRHGKTRPVARTLGGRLPGPSTLR
jgi:hypothetical protein